MDLKRVFSKDEYAEIEREARKEDQYNRRVGASIDRFNRRGARYLATGDLASLNVTRSILLDAPAIICVVQLAIHSTFVLWVCVLRAVWSDFDGAAAFSFFALAVRRG